MVSDAGGVLGWTQDHQHFRFTGPTFRGGFDFDAQAGSLAGKIGTEPWSNMRQVFRLGRLEYRTLDRSIHLIPAKVTEAVVQQPHLLAPISFDDPHGFQATQRFTLRPDSLECELRLLTVKPVESVALELSLRSEPGKLLAASDKTAEVFGLKLAEDEVATGPARIVALGDPSRPFGCVFADLGDRGRVLTPYTGSEKEAGGLYDTLNAGSVRFEFFHRPLEKGVILVGRMSLRPWRENKADLRKDFEAWYAETPFL